HAVASWPAYQPATAYPGPVPVGLSSWPAHASPATPRQRTELPFAKALACALVTYVAATALLLVVLLYHAPPDATAFQVGYLIGQSLGFFAVPGFLPGFIAGLLVRLSRRRWEGWQIAVLFLAMFFAAVTLQLIAWR